MAAGAGARPAERITPPGGDKLLLATTDFGSGTKAAFENQSTTNGVTVFLRAFQPPVRIGATRLASALSVVRVYPDKRVANAAYVEGAVSFGKASFRKELTAGVVKQLAKVSGEEFKLVRSRFGKATAVGRDGRLVILTLDTNSGRLDVAIALVHVDRIVSEVYLYSTLDGGLAPSLASRVLGIARERLRVALTVSSDGPPIIKGTAAQGQQLSFDRGSWTGGPTTFSQQWLRCDTTGTTCSPIAGATSATYSVAPEDIGSTLRVEVTGSNTVSSFKGSSPVTVPIS